MFGFALIVAIPVLVLLYSLISLAVISFSVHQKDSEVPEPVLTRTHLGSKKYEWEFTSAQKAKRDFWDCVKIFSFLWPIEAVVGMIYGVFSAVAAGLRYLIHLSTKRAEEVTQRKMMARLEDERERLMGEPHVDQDAVRALDVMLANSSALPRLKELSS